MRPTRDTLARSSVFTADEARRAGLTRRELEGPGYRTIVRGVHTASTSIVTTRLRAEAVLKIAPPGTIIARHTAAELWGGVVPHTPDIHVSVPTPARMTRLGVHGTRHALPPESTSTGSLTVTTPERTFLDLAAHLDLVDLVVLGDSLVRRGLTRPDALIAASRGHRGRAARAARRAADLVRPEVDSPMETRLRLLFVLAGLPEPVINHRIFDSSGACVFRLDLAFPEIKLAIEYDGRHHAESSQQWTSDVARREQLESWGWRLLVVLSRDVYGDPAALLRRVTEIMTQRGLPARVADTTWERHFPVRRAA